MDDPDLITFEMKSSLLVILKGEDDIACFSATNNNGDEYEGALIFDSAESFKRFCDKGKLDFERYSLEYIPGPALSKAIAIIKRTGTDVRFAVYYKDKLKIVETDKFCLVEKA